MSVNEVKIENSDVGLTTNDDGLNFNQEKSLLDKIDIIYFRFNKKVIFVFLL